MGNYISKKVTPLRRPSFGNLDQSIAVGEEIKEGDNQIDLEPETNGHDLKKVNLSVNDTNGIEENNHQISEDDELNEDDQNDHETNGHSNGHTNGHTNGNHSNGHTNGNHTNGNHSNGHLNGHDIEELNEEDNQKEEDLNEEHINIKLDKQYSNKKINLIKEDQEQELEEDEEFEVVGRKKRGKRSAAPKKQYKKRKNDVHRGIDIEVNE